MDVMTTVIVSVDLIMSNLVLAMPGMSKMVILHVKNAPEFFFAQVGTHYRVVDQIPHRF